MSGQRPQAVNKSQVVEMLDGLSLEIDDDRSSVHSDSDTSDDDSDDPPPACTTDTVPIQSGTRDSVPKAVQPLLQVVHSSVSDPSSKAVKWNSSERFRRGLFKNCVVDISSSVPSSAENSATSQKCELLLDSSANDNVGTVHDTSSSHNLHPNVTTEQSTLDRVKTCLYEWKTKELVAFLQANHCEPIHVSVSLNESTNENVSTTQDEVKDGTRNNADMQEENVKIYEREVEEFYGAKPRVHFADSCKQVTAFLPFA